MSKSVEEQLNEVRARLMAVEILMAGIYARDLAKGDDPVTEAKSLYDRYSKEGDKLTSPSSSPAFSDMFSAMVRDAILEILSKTVGILERHRK